MRQVDVVGYGLTVLCLLTGATFLGFSVGSALDAEWPEAFVHAVFGLPLLAASALMYGVVRRGRPT